MKNSFDPNTEIKEYLKKNKEEFTQNYSLNSLENYTQLLLDLIAKWESKEEGILEKIYFVKHDILNFKSDFHDEIPKNYDNKNRKHREKWTVKSRKLNGLKSEFIKIYDTYYDK